MQNGERKGKGRRARSARACRTPDSSCERSSPLMTPDDGTGKPKVLITADSYLPGSRGGGVIRSLANLVDLLGDEFSFRILTRDRDLKAPEPYPAVPVGRWVAVGKAHVLYLAPKDLSLANLRALLA